MLAFVSSRKTQSLGVSGAATGLANVVVFKGQGARRQRHWQYLQVTGCDRDQTRGTLLDVDVVWQIVNCSLYDSVFDISAHIKVTDRLHWTLTVLVLLSGAPSRYH